MLISLTEYTDYTEERRGITSSFNAIRYFIPQVLSLYSEATTFCIVGYRSSGSSYAKTINLHKLQVLYLIISITLMYK